jgi:hypothetical protein
VEKLSPKKDEVMVEIERKMKQQKAEEQKPEIIKEIKLTNAVYQSILVTK